MILRNFLFIKNITVGQFAKEIGRTPCAVFNWLSGKSRPHFGMMVKIDDWSGHEVTVEDWTRDQNDRTEGM